MEEFCWDVGHNGVAGFNPGNRWRLGRWGIGRNGGRQDPAGIATLDCCCDGGGNLNHLLRSIGNCGLNVKTINGV